LDPSRAFGRCSIIFAVIETRVSRGGWRIRWLLVMCGTTADCDD
jgi:hypothetical protein